MLKIINPAVGGNEIKEGEIKVGGSSGIHRVEELEKTVQQLRHEISRLTSKNKFENTEQETPGYKYYALSTELSQCLQSSGCDLTKFTTAYDQAIKALQTFGEGFTSILSSMRSKLFPINRSILNFMHSTLDDLQSLRAQLTIIQNYIAVLEFNESILRQSLQKQEKTCQTTRSQSVSRMNELLKLETSNKSKNFVLEIAPKIKQREDFSIKLNKLKLRICKLKNLKERAEIDNERLLIQLKQAKEQIAICEEEAANRELALELRYQKLMSVVVKLKEIPTIRPIVSGIEQQVYKSDKKHFRTRSGIIVFNN